MIRKINYLLSAYPAISHTFFISEIRHLRSRGFDIDVSSINDCDRTDGELTQIEREEKSHTFYIKSAGAATIGLAHLGAIFLSPRGYFRALAYAFSLAKGGPLSLVYRLFYFIEAIVLTQRMKATGARHLHVHFGSEVATVALIAKKAGNFSFSLTIHGSDEFYDAPGYHLKEKIQQSDFIFCISHYTRSQLMRLSDYSQWHKLVFAPLGIDPDRFLPEKRNRSSNQVNILCVSRLNAAKGLHLLFHAFAHLVAGNPLLRLTLVGDGEQKASLSELAMSLGIHQYIDFAGAINQDQITQYYARADVFCLPSFAEGVPVVLMEAMASGIPCVTTRITGIPELIRDNEDGLLVTAGDIDSLELALGRLVSSRVLRESLGISARKRVIDKYNLTKNFDILSQHFLTQLDALDKPATNEPDFQKRIEHHG